MLRGSCNVAINALINALLLPNSMSCCYHDHTLQGCHQCPAATYTMTTRCTVDVDISALLLP